MNEARSWGSWMRRIGALGACLLAAGCWTHQVGESSPRPEPAADDREPTMEASPPTQEDPPVENPIRDEGDPPVAPRPVVTDPAPAPETSDEVIRQPEVVLEGLLSAWIDNRVVELIFPGNRLLRGPEFLDGGPNTLYRICVEDGTPEHICRQRYGP